MFADAVAALRAEAIRADERRLLVLAGTPSAARGAAADAVAALDPPPASVALVGPEPVGGWERIEPARANRLLGETREVVVVDAHESLAPNVLGRVVGAVDGGGLFVLLAPPLGEWPDRRDGFDGTLAVPPAGVDDVTGHFRSRLVETLRAHPGIAIADADDRVVERDGLTHPAPRLPRDDPEPPADHAFPAAAYDACLTADQVDAVAALEALGGTGRAVVVEADRGRGKSSAAGLAAGALAAEGRDVLVVAPQYRNAAQALVRARDLLAATGDLAAVDDGDEPRRLGTTAGRVRFRRAADATGLPGDPDAVIVDEAAALPVRALEAYLGAPSAAFTTTVHGYEGAGRGFSVRFRGRLGDSGRDLAEVRMDEPIRYAPGDPVEVWAFRALLLDARPPVGALVTGADPESVTYERLDPGALLADEHLLREAFGLLVLAHYRTEPDDLARLLDAPNVSARALRHDGHVVSVALLAREGGLPAGTRAEMYEGGRIRGNMIPDVLATQLRDESAPAATGLRVMRIATHAAARSRGLGSHLLSRVRAEFAADVDWLGVGYGATPDLLRFWGRNGYRTVHLSTTRNERSGEHSAIMLDPTSEAGRAIHDRHAAWFLGRIAGMLSDPLEDLDPEVARAAIRRVDAAFDPGLGGWEWRLAAGAAGGAGTFDTAPGPFRRLAVKHLADPVDPGLLGDRAERLLVAKPLQGRPWGAVADELGFQSRRQCLRAFGDAAGLLVEAYGTDEAVADLERLR